MAGQSLDRRDIVRIVQALDFAARKHVSQKRKGAAGEPYINHLAEVALLIAEATQGRDPGLVIAALLHDTIEDQNVKYEELAAEFGKDVADLVAEVTDDKRLPKEERKRLQVETAPGRSGRAKMLKIADKIANLRSIRSSPPSHWTEERQRAYFDWAARVVAGCRGVSPTLEALFDEVHRRGPG